MRDGMECGYGGSGGVEEDGGGGGRRVRRGLLGRYADAVSQKLSFSYAER